MNGPEEGVRMAPADIALEPAGEPAGFTGLSSQQVRERILAGQANELPNDSSRSLWQILRANVLTLFNGIVGGGFVLLMILGQWRDALFGFAAVGNAVIGVVQEYRAKSLLDRLAVLESPRARVLRGGSLHDIPAAGVVRDDILVLRPGDQVTADAILLECDGLEIDESLLSGESDPVAKPSGAEALSGSIVLAGQGTARVIRVGAGSFASSLTAEAKRFSLVNSEIRNGINKVLRWVSWALLPAMAIVINGQMQAQGGWEHALETGAWTGAMVGVVGSSIAMIPLGLVLLTSVAFAVGGVRLAREKVLLQELAAVEGLARVDVLCLDKTGTLTEGGITFDAFHPVGNPQPPGWEAALGWFGADPNANATARSLASSFPALATGAPSAVASFSSLRKWSAAAFPVGRPAAGTWFIGAPEIVLTGDGPATVRALDAARTLAAGGRRTLVLAHTPQVLPVDDDRRVAVPPAPVPVVLLTFREKVRSDAARTLAYFRRQGVALKILSGDAPATVAAVAREVGLDADEGYDARNLPADPGLLEQTLEEHSVFGRVTPGQKKEMVLALKRRGHTVAMTGDGVNDVLALKQADMGIAMDSAAAATKAVARMVLLDGRFARLPAVLAEGRRVIANMERVSILFLSKTAYALALSLSFGSVLWSFPFLPRQLSATDGLTIGIPAFFLALMPNAVRSSPGFLKRSLSFAVPAGIIITIAVFAVNAYARITGGTTVEAVRTASVFTLSVVALSVLVEVSRPINLIKACIVGVMCAGLALVLTVPLLSEFFMLEWPPPALAAAAVVSAALGTGAIAVMARFQAHKRPRAGLTGPGAQASARPER
jgi:cation-transporting ATPase E